MDGAPGALLIPASGGEGVHPPPGLVGHDMGQHVLYLLASNNTSANIIVRMIASPGGAATTKC